MNWPAILLDADFVLWLRRFRQLQIEATPEKLYLNALIPMPPLANVSDETRNRMLVADYNWAEQRRVELMDDYSIFKTEKAEKTDDNDGKKDYNQSACNPVRAGVNGIQHGR